MKLNALALAGMAAMAVYAIPAAAHHSFAMFDASKTVTLEAVSYTHLTLPTIYSV